MTISTRLFSLQMLDQFKFIEERLQGLQTQIATGSRIPQSSEQPMDAVTLSARRELESNITQYQKNLNKVNDRLSLVDATLEEGVNIAIRLKELFVQANTSTSTQVERMAAREEVLRFKEAFLSLANTTDSSGDALFGGFSTEATPFREQLDGSVKYFGDGGEHMLSVSETIKLPTSLNGANAFMEIDVDGKNKSVFDVLNSFANSLFTNDSLAQSHTGTAGSDVSIKFNSSRAQQDWSFKLTGPSGSEVISGSINSDSPAEIVAAINAASTGVTASASSDGVITLTGAGAGETISISEVSIGNYDIAQKEPDYYISVYTPGTDTIIEKISDQTQGLLAQGSQLDAMINGLAVSRTKVGARVNNAETQESVLQSRLLVVKTEIGTLQDADIESLITELQTILVNRDAARQTYTTVSNRSLFDFLS